MKRLFKAITVFSFITCLILFASKGLEVKAETAITFTIVSPQTNSIQYDTLKVAISKPNSTYTIADVRAKVDDREAALTYNESAYDSMFGPCPGWAGNLNLNGLPRGSKTVEVTVKDTHGNSITNKAIFKYTQKPTLIVNSPKDFDFSNGYLDLDVKASDLAGEKCTIKTYILGDGRNKEKIIEAVGSINNRVDLNKYNGQSKYISFEVSNETGGTNSITKKINIDNSQLLAVKDKVDGEILDYNYNRILYKTAKNELKIKDLQTSSEQLVYSNYKNLVSYGYLTSLGTMFVVQNVSPYYTFKSLFEYRNNALSYVGRLNSDTSLKVNGNYAIWNGDLEAVDGKGILSGEQLYLKDLINNNIIQVSNEACNYDNYVTSKGEVFYSTDSGWSAPGDTTFNYNVYKCYNGSTTKLSKDDSYFNMFPLSDGNITIYTKDKYGENVYSLILNVNGQEQIIATSNNGGFTPDINYKINNGYVAFTNYVDGINQIFLWKDGNSKQLTNFTTDSFIQDLNQQGDIIARSNNGYFIIKNDNSQPVKLYNIAGLKTYWINNELYGAIDGSLLKIETNTAPVSRITLPKH